MLNSFHFCDNAPVKKNDEIVILERRENQKYHITALFYGENMLYGDNKEYSVSVIDYMVLSDNNTGAEVRYVPTDSDNEQSSDFILLMCGRLMKNIWFCRLENVTVSPLLKREML